ncbi:unnamed protein product [Discosporangium mesarthrocarpum]
MVGEMIKFVFSMGMIFAGQGAVTAEGKQGLARLVWLMKHSLRMLVPALIFWAMNLLSFVSLARIDASTFTVCAQMKVLTTAIFSVVMLNRSLHPRKWRSLLLLVVSVTLVSDGSFRSSAEGSSGQDGGGAITVGDDDSGRVTRGVDSLSYLLGLMAVLVEVTLSGYVSVYFEKVIKARVPHFSIWERNFQVMRVPTVLCL